jgi:hypothetical protein
MGSFNTSCFVSRQTVAPGDACKVVPIRQQHTYQLLETTFQGVQEKLWGHCHTTCYPTRFWEPVSGFFDAVYDDYGQFTLTDNASNRSLLDEFLSQALRHVPVVLAGKNPSHDVPCDLQAFMAQETPQLLKHLAPTEKASEVSDPHLLWAQAVQCWDYLWEVSREARLFWSDCDKVLRPTSFSVIHIAAFNELVELTGRRVGYSDESYDMREFFNRGMVEVKQWMRGRQEAKAKKTGSDTLAAPEPGDLVFAPEKLLQSFARVAGNLNFRRMADTEVLYDAFDAYFGGTLDDDGLYEVCKPMLEVRYACSGLEAMNLHFEPIVYAGQDYSNELGVSYAEFVNKVSKKVVRGRDVYSYGEVNLPRLNDLRSL